MPGFVAACPRLTELTVISHYAQNAGRRVSLDLAGRARSAISELVVACKTLPDFDTLQIVHFPIVPTRSECWCGLKGCGSHWPSVGWWEPALEKQVKDLTAWVVGCLKGPKMGRREVEGRRITLRVIEFGPGRPCQSPVKVEEYEVCGFDSKHPQHV